MLEGGEDRQERARWDKMGQKGDDSQDRLERTVRTDRTLLDSWGTVLNSQEQHWAVRKSSGQPGKYLGSQGKFKQINEKDSSGQSWPVGNSSGPSATFLDSQGQFWTARVSSGQYE